MKQAPIGWPCNQFGWIVQCEKCQGEAKFRRSTNPRDAGELPVAWYLMLPTGPAQPTATSVCEVLCENCIKNQGDLRHAARSIQTA